MITINQIKTEIRFETAGQRLELEDMLDSREVLQKKAAKILGINMTDVSGIVILKHSIDARKKPQIFHAADKGAGGKGCQTLQEQAGSHVYPETVSVSSTWKTGADAAACRDRYGTCRAFLRISARTARLQADHTGARF